jgi:sigma-B regulation protein RsbQ
MMPSTPWLHRSILPCATPLDIQKRNNIHIVGEGPATIVLAHGFGCDQSMWRYFVPAFGAQYRIVLFDLAGNGNADLAAYDSAKYASLQGHAQDVLEIIDHCGGGPVVFIGHSVSAMIGMLASIAAPDKFVANIMVAPSARYIDDAGYRGGFSQADIHELLDTMDSNYLGWSSSMAPAIMGAPDQPDLGAELTNSFCRTDPTIARHFARVTFLSDQRAELAKSTVPTLILQCSDDLIAPVEVGQFIHRMVRRSTLAMIDNTGHCPHLSAPGPSIDAIRGFLATLA